MDPCTGLVGAHPPKARPARAGTGVAHRPSPSARSLAACSARTKAAFTPLTLRIRPGIYFQDHPAFNGARRELTAQDYVHSIKRIYDPRHKRQRDYLLESQKLLGISEIRAGAHNGGRVALVGREGRGWMGSKATVT